MTPKRPTDHRQPPQRRAYADATGKRAPETLASYFDFRAHPDKAERPVTRHELAVILSHVEMKRPYRRFMRWLKSWVTPKPKPEVNAGGPTP